MSKWPLKVGVCAVIVRWIPRSIIIKTTYHHITRTLKISDTMAWIPELKSSKIAFYAVKHEQRQCASDIIPSGPCRYSFVVFFPVIPFGCTAFLPSRRCSVWDILDVRNSRLNSEEGATRRTTRKALQLRQETADLNQIADRAEWVF
jgi:hypothetical protein